MEFKQKLLSEFYVRNIKRIQEEITTNFCKFIRGSISIVKNENISIENYVNFKYEKNNTIFSCFIRYFENGIFNVKIREENKSESDCNKNPLNFNENLRAYNPYNLKIFFDEKKILIKTQDDDARTPNEFSDHLNIKDVLFLKNLNENKNVYTLEIILEKLIFNYYINDRIVSSINKSNKLNLERDYNDNFSEEKLSCTLDYTSHNSSLLFGLAERNNNFELEDTDEISSYRLFNLDVFEQETNSNQILYGSIPLIHSIHNDGQFIDSFFLNNTSEIWVDIKTVSNGNNYKESQFVTESGILDFYVFGDNNLQRNYFKVSLITGFSILPPLFSLGYHQCRWGYNNQENIENIEKNMDLHDIPYDVIWLDIDHTEEKKYFVWDKKNFPNMEEFLQKLDSESKRKLVTIIDPHLKCNVEKSTDVLDNTKVLKNEENLTELQENQAKIIDEIENLQKKYHISELLLNENCLVSDRNKCLFVGECWPGISNWADFLNPKIQSLYDRFYKDESYFLNATNFHSWLDMNEPAVFEQTEKSFPRDNLHFNGKEYIYHRDVHNIYGQQYQKVAYNSLLNRYDLKKRVFVLSRSFFAGSQKYGFIWTGDNRADYNFLQYSIPTLQTICSSGINACGADVGGFFGEASEKLLKTWFSLGIFYPFFRGHSHCETSPREPCFQNSELREHIRNSIITRYSILLYIYTKFFESCISGAPLIKPVFLDWDFYKKFNMDKNFNHRDYVRSSFIFGNEFIIAPFFQEENKVYPVNASENPLENIKNVNEDNVIESNIKDINSNIIKQDEKIPFEEIKMQVELQENPFKVTDSEFKYLNLPKNVIDQYVLYDFFTGAKVKDLNDLKELNFKLKEKEDSIYLVKGGNIIPRQYNIKKSSYYNLRQNITLNVYLDIFGKSKGALYLDDGESFDYSRGNFIYNQYQFDEKPFHFSSMNLNKGKNNPEYLKDCYYNNLKYDRIVFIGTNLQDKDLIGKKFILKNSRKKTEISFEFEINIKIEYSSLIFENLNMADLFIFEEFEIVQV